MMNYFLCCQIILHLLWRFKGGPMRSHWPRHTFIYTGKQLICWPIEIVQVRWSLWRCEHMSDQAKSIFWTTTDGSSEHAVVGGKYVRDNNSVSLSFSWSLTVSLSLLLTHTLSLSTNSLSLTHTNLPRCIHTLTLHKLFHLPRTLVTYSSSLSHNTYLVSFFLFLSFSF